MPAKACCGFHYHIGENSHYHPAILGIPDRLGHLAPPARVVIDPIKHADCDANLKNRDENLLHSPKRSFHIWTDCRIASALLFGLISQTNKQFEGRSGTSFSKFTLPLNGGS